MKRLFTYLVAATLLTGGCVKPTTTNVTSSSAAPDVTGFTITLPSTYIPQSTVTAIINSPKLTDGQYTLTYELTTDLYPSGSTTSALVNFAGGTGTFTLSGLSGCSTIKATAIYKSGGTTSTLNNTASICDSSGVMAATYNSTAFNTKTVIANLYGSTLTVSGSIPVTSGTYSSYNKKTIQFSLADYTQSPKTVTFNGATWGYTTASYASPTNSQTAVYGKITIATSSPILSGSFSFTCQDSSKIAGTFSVAAP